MGHLITRAAACSRNCDIGIGRQFTLSAKLGLRPGSPATSADGPPTILAGPGQDPQRPSDSQKMAPDPARAVESLRQAVLKLPDDIDLRLLLVGALCDAGEVDDAWAEITGLVVAAPGNPDVLNAGTDVATRRSDHATAAAYQQAVAIIVEHTAVPTDPGIERKPRPASPAPETPPPMQMPAGAGRSHLPTVDGRHARHAWFRSGFSTARGTGIPAAATMRSTSNGRR